jgi:hypothetical protein
VVVVGAYWNCSPAAEAAESVVVELILDINPSGLQGDVSEVDRERERWVVTWKKINLYYIFEEKTDPINNVERLTRFLVEN